MDLDNAGIGEQRRRTRPTLQANALDVSLEDTELLEEMRLTTELLIAAAQSPSHLDPTEIDRALGLGSMPSAP